MYCTRPRPNKVREFLKLWVNTRNGIKRSLPITKCNYRPERVSSDVACRTSVVCWNSGVANTNVKTALADISLSIYTLFRCRWCVCTWKQNGKLGISNYQTNTRQQCDRRTLERGFFVSSSLSNRNIGIKTHANLFNK